MKLDMSQTWDDAMVLLKSNRDLLWIVAATFLFLPSLALSVLAPGTEMEAAAENPDQLQAAMTAYLSAYWPYIAIYLVLNFAGSLAMFALMGRRDRPTVGEAIKIGLIGLVPYVMSIVLIGMAAGVLIAIVSLLGMATGVNAIGVTLVLLAIIVFLAFSFRLILVAPVIAIEQQFNPVTALIRSWNLVKGNTRRVVLFVVLITMVAAVISFMVSSILGLFSALVGPELALWIQGIGSGALGAAVSVVIVAVYAAIYHRLSGEVKAVSETFE